ncbi:MAG: trimeric intracellular cation channel family protein [Halothiobacillaceae bacterium]|nr:trimeric intracellular cation channel family protein [Halothiobacillaceae bacterium]
MHTLIHVLDLFGVMVFALSGALVAARKGMDWMGFSLVAIVTGIGGGTLRDLLLDRPVYWLTQWYYLVLCILTALATFYLARHLHERLGWLLWADAIGLAAFTVIGNDVTLSTGASPFIAVVMGVMTATFGGLIRDVLCGEPPLLLHREVYATAALAGGIVFVSSLTLGLGDWVAALAAFLVTLIVRGLGIVYHLHLPSFPREEESGG